MLMRFQVMAAPTSRGLNILEFLAIYHANILFDPKYSIWSHSIPAPPPPPRFEIYGHHANYMPNFPKSHSQKVQLVLLTVVPIYSVFEIYFASTAP